MKELEKKVKQLDYEFNLIKPEIEKNYNTLGLEMRLEELKDLVENLSLCAVSHRRELLKSFADWLQGEVWDNKYDDFSEYVDDYEKTL
jgi:sugar-specific transcriptional regulator TrmB